MGTANHSAALPAASSNAVHRLTASGRLPRSGLQAPVGQYKACVAYLKNGKEHFSPWFYSQERATRAREILARRFGAAIVVRD